MILNTLGLR